VWRNVVSGISVFDPVAIQNSTHRAETFVDDRISADVMTNVGSARHDAAASTSIP